MLRQLAFDNVCHEHMYYYELSDIESLFGKHGFKIMDCQLNDVNSGSFRIYVMKDIGDETVFSSQPYRDVCKYRVNSILDYEYGNSPVTQWKFFYKNITNGK